MEQQNESVKELEVGRDYINKDGLIVIDRLGAYGNRGIDGSKYEHDLFCSSPYVWREANEEEVVEAFEKHLPHRFGEDWRTMKIKERHPDLPLYTINDGLWIVEIDKDKNGWNVWNKNGLLYCDGIWVERLEEEEEEPKITIQDAIKENTVIHCETEEEAKRILGMAHELGYRWYDEDKFTYTNEWNVYGNKTCYDIKGGVHGGYQLYRSDEYTIINSTDITDMKKSTDWTTPPEDIEAMKKYTIEITDDGKTTNISRKNDGFNAIELIGFMEMIKGDLIAQFKGLAEDKVDVITKQAVKRE